jgi:hypothetical protein
MRPKGNAMTPNIDHGKAPEGECVYCDKERAAGNRYHPRHNASERCQSGKRPHCSCDTCY